VRGCAFEVDHVEGALVHLRNHDVSYAAVARAPIEEIENFRQAHGLAVPVRVVFQSDFNYDFNVSFAPKSYGGTIYYNYQDRQIPMEDLRVAVSSTGTRTARFPHLLRLVGTEECSQLRVPGPDTQGATENGPHHSLGRMGAPADMYGKGGTVEGKWSIHAADEASAESDMSHGGER